MIEDVESARLFALDGVAVDDVWAVGVGFNPDTDLSEPLVEHWDGSSWAAIPFPPLEFEASLDAVVEIASDDVWVTGHRLRTFDSPEEAFIAHWDGSSFELASLPVAGSGNVLTGLAAFSPMDVWAVGWYSDNDHMRTLAEHWDGTSWVVVPTPTPNGDGWLRAVDGSSPRDLWAVGSSGGGTLTEHWDGVSWRMVPSPTPGSYGEPSDVTALSRRDVWAVGSSYRWHTDDLYSFWHWNGRKWTATPQDSGIYSPSTLEHIAGRFPGEVWAGGSNSGWSPALQLWDGTAWSGAPLLNRLDGTIQDLDAIAQQVWAIGDPLYGSQPSVARVCPLPVLDAGFAADDGTVPLGSEAFWNIDPRDSSPHGVADASGMSLFHSGLKFPGTSFHETFFAAGTYPIIDPVSGDNMTVRVPIRAAPREGTEASLFLVTWASSDPPVGYVYDAQILRPGSDAFVDWVIATWDRDARFEPDGGTGTYAFRARLRRSINESHSGWSPPASIVVA